MKLLPLLLSIFAVQMLSAQTAFRLEQNQKSDVVFSGVENPITVEISGASKQNIQLIPSFGEIKKDSIGNFLWKICHLDSNRAILIVRDLSKNKNLDTVIFKVKMIPPPTVYFQRFNRDSRCSPRGVFAIHESVLFDIRCDVIFFRMTYYPKGQDSVDRVSNKMGFGFGTEISELMNKAKPGDKYVISKIRFKCGCDDTERRHSESLSWEIK